MWEVTEERRAAFARVETGGIDAAVRHAVELAGGLEQLIDSSSSVLVKPNLWSLQRS